MGYKDYLTREERLARIGALLAKGIFLMLSKEAEEKRKMDSQTLVMSADERAGESRCENAANATCRSDEDHRKILEYLQRVESASPRHMQRALSMSKATLFRRLTELLTAGLVVRAGKTTGVHYRMVEQHGCHAGKPKPSPRLPQIVLKD